MNFASNKLFCEAIVHEIAYPNSPGKYKCYFKNRATGIVFSPIHDIPLYAEYLSNFKWL